MRSFWDMSFRAERRRVLYFPTRGRRWLWQLLEGRGIDNRLFEEVHRIWRDLRIAPIGGGTSVIQKEIIGRLIGL